MRRMIVFLLCLFCARAYAARELVHPFPATGPAEVSGTVAASKMLRAMQRYTMPAFTDALAMHAALALSGPSEEPFAVLRKPRHAGNEARAYVAAARADGGTLLLAILPESSALQSVGLVATMPYVVIAAAERSLSTPSPAASVTSSFRRTPESILTFDARAGRNPLIVASPGERTPGHLALEMLRSRGRFALEPVAYNGGHGALNALATKQASVAIVPLPAVLPYLGGGRLRALAIAQPQRHVRIPDVPTSSEAGLADLSAASSFVVFAQTATPTAALSELRANLARSLEAAATLELFSALGLERTLSVRHEIATSPRSSR